MVNLVHTGVRRLTAPAGRVTRRPSWPTLEHVSDARSSRLECGTLGDVGTDTGGHGGNKGVL
jgi:hypothetical protein